MLEASEEKVITLNNLPNEILLQIFSNLNDTSLLHSSRVCKFWKCLSKETFAKKYNGSTEEKYYTLKVFSENLVEERKQYLPIFRNFGENVGALSIEFVQQGSQIVADNHWVISLIQSFCHSITKVKITNGEKVDLVNIIGYMPNLSHLCLGNVTMLNHKWTKLTFHLLTHFTARHVQELDNDHFVLFFNHNRKIQNASLVFCSNVTNDIIFSVNDELKQLKTLMLWNDHTIFNYSSNIKIESLTSFSVKVAEGSFIDLFRSIHSGCKNVEHLTIRSTSNYMKLEINHINLICSFNLLKTITLDNFDLPLKLLKILVRELPNLISLSISDAERFCETHDDLLSIVTACKKLSFLKLVADPFLPKLNYDFYTRFVAVLESAASNLKLEICTEDFEDKFILTKEEVRLLIEPEEQSVRYWKGYDTAYSSSKTNLFELNENILLKIVDFLNGNDLYAFHRTCKNAQQLVEKHLPQAIFSSSLEPSSNPTEVIIDESVFRTLGEYVLRMKVDLEDSWVNAGEETVDHEKKAKKHFNAINKYCRNLTELEINGNVESESVLCWPKLKKLYINEVNNQTLRLFSCPELTELEINSFDGNNVQPNEFAAFENLTILKFGYYSEHVEKFLYSLNEKISDQMKEVSLKGYNQNWFAMNQHHRWITLSNIITRFRNLETLRLLIPGIENLNFKFVFENCSMLTEMSIKFTCQYRYRYFDALKQIILNCKRMKTIELVGNCSCCTFTKVAYLLFRETQTKVEVIHGRSRK